MDTRSIKLGGLRCGGASGGGSSLFQALPSRIFASLFPLPLPPGLRLRLRPPRPRWPSCLAFAFRGGAPLRLRLLLLLLPLPRLFRALSNQSAGSSRSSSWSSSARCSIRNRSLLRARLPTLMGALVPQPSPNVSSFASQSRGPRARVGPMEASEKGPERML
jgi:hypothetical protein